MTRLIRQAQVTALGFSMLVGCAVGGIKTYPVKGKVELKDGDAQLLTGSHVELKHESDPELRPTGKIAADGTFAVQTLHGGKIVRGAPEGKYQARVILADESDEGVVKRKGNPVHPRYFDFATSGLSFTIPSGDLTVSLSRK
jgi:hypothetical protein